MPKILPQDEHGIPKILPPDKRGIPKILPQDQRGIPKYITTISTRDTRNMTADQQEIIKI